MKLNIQEIRKQPEGLHFEQNLDLAADLRKRNQEILDVKDIVAVGKVQYEDLMYFLDYQLSYTIVLASSRSMEPGRIERIISSDRSLYGRCYQSTGPRSSR